MKVVTKQSQKCDSSAVKARQPANFLTQACRPVRLPEATVKVRDGMAVHDLLTREVQKGRLGA